MRKKKLILSGLTMLLTILISGKSVSAGTVYESPYVSFSPDGRAFTTNAGDRTGTWYTEEDSFSTGIISALRGLKEGEHYYKTDRAGKIPVGEWRMSWRPGVCCHDNYPPADKPFHGLSFKKEICSAKYYSGWFAYCADCKEIINPIYIYMSKEAARTITELDMDLEYYYLCPYNGNLEQGASMGMHQCNKISWNKYKVVYNANTTDIYGGYMEASIHMYNNETEFEGRPITPATQLTGNKYTIIGKEFVEWNTKPDGTGLSFSDGQEIFNITMENLDKDDSSKGIITLYAQWKQSQSTLLINPAGGTFEGVAGISSYKKSYGEKYIPDSNKLVPPNGYNVSFDTNGGKPIDNISSKLTFVNWKMSQPFHGDFWNGKYTYLGKDGTSDTLTAQYQQETIILPSAEKDNSSFGGWYYDPECKKPAGSARDKFTPERNITLYAKWVGLVLTSADNYTADGGRGAVDLTWEQKDDKQKTYLIFQSRDNINWTKVSSANDITSNIKIEETFRGNGTYTIPYSGLYVLSAFGAQGGNYGVNPGGAGGAVSGTVWLNKGEILTYAAGGQDGTNGGGKGTMFANGGGCTVLSSNQKDNLLIAGGGGGATSQGIGGAGGSTASNIPSGIQGQDGGAGGGGGYRGGSAGEYIVHNHTAACWHSEKLDYVLFNKAVGTGSHNAQSYVTGNYHSGGTDRYGSGGHTADGGAEALYNLGWTDVKGNTSVNIHGYFEILGQAMFRYVYSDQAYDGGNCYIRVLDQNNNEIFRKRVYDLPRYTSVADMQRGTGTYGNPADGFLGERSGYAIYNHAYWNESILLPEGTTQIRMESRMEVQEHLNGEGAWFNASFSQIDFSGGTRSYTICGYDEGQVVSAKPAYGGSNYIKPGQFITAEEQSGMQSGNGYAAISSVSVGYLEELALQGVKATDCAAPDPVDPGKVIKEHKKDSITVAWSEPKDNGTPYYHKAESYLFGSTNRLSESNTTINTLTSKVKGYFYLIDQAATATVTSSHTFLAKGGEQLNIPLITEDQYLHLAAVDVAGNISAAIHIPVSRKDAEVAWNLATEKPSVSSKEDSVYPASNPDTYYVRCDGVTPFTLTYDSSILGEASPSYQINHTIFSTVKLHEGPGSQTYDIYTPSHEITNGTIITNADGLKKDISGEPILVGGDLLKTTRSNYCKELNVLQRFVMGQEQHGNKIQVTPIVGAEYKDDVKYSDHNADLANSIYLIGDGQAPVVNGDEMLEGMDLINRNDGEVQLDLHAEDTLSGVKEFTVEIYNTDNAGNKKYLPDGTGHIKIDITKDSPIFSGDFQIIIYTKDNVGNENTVVYGTTEFSLTTSVSRILEPHDPIFKTGESGILNIVTYGYADRVEVEFPAEMTALNPDLNTTFHYGEYPLYRQEENLQFMVPLYTPLNQTFQITVRAYKDGKQLEDYPAFSTIGIDGSVLNEIRTRLR